MQRDSFKRRVRVAPGIYAQDGGYFAGFNEPGTKRWMLAKLDATTLRDAKRERESRIAALREGRAATKSGLTFDTCLDRYLAALEQGGRRDKTVNGNRWIAKKYIRDALGAKAVQEITTDDVRDVLRSVNHLSGWPGAKVLQ